MRFLRQQVQSCFVERRLIDDSVDDDAMVEVVVVTAVVDVVDDDDAAAVDAVDVVVAAVVVVVAGVVVVVDDDDVAGNLVGRMARHSSASDCMVDRATATGVAWLRFQRRRRRRHQRLRLRLRQPRVTLGSVPGVRGDYDGGYCDDDDDDGAGYPAWPSAGLPEGPPLSHILAPCCCYSLNYRRRCRRRRPRCCHRRHR